MASTIKAGNATDGIQITSDNTGALDIKTGTGAGTTAISIDASQNVAIPGTLTIAGQPAGGNYALNSYVAPATWTKPTGLKAIKVTVVGGGGAGGSATLNAPFPGGLVAAGGGGGGGAAIDYIPAPSIPGPVAVTAGPGTNSFGAFCSATGGATTNATNTTDGAGGAGGAGSSGTINLTGQSGEPGNNGPINAAGAGGASAAALGYGASAVGPATNGNAGIAYGGGGSGGKSSPLAPFPRAGGAASSGIVIVEEFY